MTIEAPTNTHFFMLVFILPIASTLSNKNLFEVHEQLTTWSIHYTVYDNCSKTENDSLNCYWCFLNIFIW